MKNAKSHLACGTCILALLVGLVATPSAQAQTFTTLHSFDHTDGNEPLAAPVQATDGNLYGTTQSGGANNAGTVFKITPSGTLTTVQNFDGPDGGNPTAGLIQATDGNVYGTTSGGGHRGNGVIFSLMSSGKLIALYEFCAKVGCPDGSDPGAALVQGTDGNFYGTTVTGGANGEGTAFKITPSDALTTLHSFQPPGDHPAVALVQGTDGNFYGTTFSGGHGFGTVFRMTPSGTLATIYNFCPQSGCADGANPEAALLQGTDGNFYGTTEKGGTDGVFGTVFKITSSGKLTTLYTFCPEGGICPDGSSPVAALVQASDGNFYGTTLFGGAKGSGTIFEITSNGALTTLYSFGSQSGDGGDPYAALVQDTNGSFYGTTSQGGSNGGYGTVFSLSVGPGPFVETQTTSGKVGAAVKILGTNLTGATSVSFNGTAATFTVVSPSLITTTVPAGATTGTVQVVTPSGTLSSNAPFRVLP